MLSCQLQPSTMSSSNLPAQIGVKKRFSGQRFLCSAHSLPIRLLRRSYVWPEEKNMTVWPSGLRRWLQAPVRKGMGSNPTAVSSLQQSCVAAAPATELNQHFCPNAHSKTLRAQGAVGRLLVSRGIASAAESDSCGVRTHALADWRLKPAP